MVRDVTVTKVVYSGYDWANQMFRRKLVGADGYGYEFIRAAEVDVQNYQIERAVAADIRAWLKTRRSKSQRVVAYAPRHNPMREIKWLPPIELARPTRSYLCPIKQRVEARVTSRDGEIYNIYVPARMLGKFLAAHETVEAELRETVYGSTLPRVFAGHDLPADGAAPH